MHHTTGNFGGLAYTILHLKLKSQPKSSAPFLTKKGSHPLLDLGKTTLCEEQNKENPRPNLYLIYKVQDEACIRGVIMNQIQNLNESET